MKIVHKWSKTETGWKLESFIAVSGTVEVSQAHLDMQPCPANDVQKTIEHGLGTKLLDQLYPDKTARLEPELRAFGKLVFTADIPLAVRLIHNIRQIAYDTPPVEVEQRGVLSIK